LVLGFYPSNFGRELKGTYSRNLTLLGKVINLPKLALEGKKGYWLGKPN